MFAFYVVCYFIDQYIEETPESGGNQIDDVESNGREQARKEENGGGRGGGGER